MTTVLIAATLLAAIAGALTPLGGQEQDDGKENAHPLQFSAPAEVEHGGVAS